MKLKNGICLHIVDGEYMGVTTGEAAAVQNSFIHNNETANFIYQRLMTETTEEQIVDAMLKEYDAPRDIIAKDVHRIIGTIREAGLLDE